MRLPGELFLLRRHFVLLHARFDKLCDERDGELFVEGKVKGDLARGAVVF